MSEPALLPAPPQEPERVSGTAAAVVVGVSVVVFGVAIAAAAGVYRHDVTATGVAASSLRQPSGPPRRTIGLIEQTLIEDTAVGWHRHESKRRQLQETKWLDRERGVAQISIAQAMDAVVEKGAAK